MNKFKILFIAGISSVGCTTGTNYPTKYANALCETSYKCLDADELELVFGYDDEDECISEVIEAMSSSDVYEDYQLGNNDFNGESAQLCITEVVDVQSDSDCDGSMNAWTFLSDIADESCNEVYTESE
jgi:hypothetical protein